MPADLPLLLQGGIFVALLLAASVIDIRKRIIPNTVCVGIVLTSFLLFDPINVLGVFTAVLFLLPAIFCGGMGGGDIKLMAACGMYLDLNRSLAAGIIGLSLWILYFYIKTFGKRRDARRLTALPVAPFLSFGCIAALIFNIGG